MSAVASLVAAPALAQQPEALKVRVAMLESEAVVWVPRALVDQAQPFTTAAAAAVGTTVAALAALLVVDRHIQKERFYTTCWETAAASLTESYSFASASARRE